MKLTIYKTENEVLLDVDNVVVWQGSLSDWSRALANPWKPTLPPLKVADAPCDVEDTA